MLDYKRSYIINITLTVIYFTTPSLRRTVGRRDEDADREDQVPRAADETLAETTSSSIAPPGRSHARRGSSAATPTGR